MKKVIKRTLTAAALCIAVVNYGNEVSHSTEQRENTPTHLNFGMMTAGTVVIIKNHHGLILYKESIKRSGAYSKDFDLTSLPDGTYYFELNKNYEIKIIPFTVASNTVTFNKEKEKIIKKPRVTISGDHVIVSRASSEEQPMEVKIYYEGQELAYSEKIKNEKNIRRVYSFSTSSSGSYKIVLKAEGRKFVKNVTF